MKLWNPAGRARLLCGALAALVCSAAAAQPPAKPKTGEATVTAVSKAFPVPVSVRVRLNKAKSAPSAPLAMSLTLANTAKETAHLRFNSGQKYDFEIRKGKGAAGPLLWKWSKGQMFIEMLTTVAVEPGKSLTFTETYKPGDKDGLGKPLPELAPGLYTVIGTVMASGRPQPTATAALEITK